MGGFLSHLKPEPNSEILYASCGPIRGNVYSHVQTGCCPDERKEKFVFGYLGIPISKEKKRFEKPIPAEVWIEPINCTQYGPGCPQSGPFDSMREQLSLKFEENTCLTVNVFAPRAETKRLPVMVNIFGGGFEMGTSAAYNDYSISGTLPLKDVIVVTLNYRVGVFGFFTTGDEVCPGNLALWDQTLALTWVKDHIESFGGDPSNVTVFGCSVGGVCADLLTLSPHSRSLFHKCIAMSGTANCEMACRSLKVQAEIFNENGYSGTDSADLLDWYKAQSVDLLKTIGTFKYSASGFMSCAPVLDGNFFNKSLEMLREEAPKKTFMIGGTEYEGLMMAINDPVYSKIGSTIDASASKLFGPDVVEDPVEVLHTLKHVYEDGVDESNKKLVRTKFIEFLGDAVFNIGILIATESATLFGNDVYLYSFDYCNPEGFGDLGSIMDFKAATHGSDFRYVLGDGGTEKFDPTEEEFKVMDWMITSFSAFSKYGTPHIDWEKYDLTSPNDYFKIDFPTPRMSSNYQNRRLEILKRIHRKPL